MEAPEKIYIDNPNHDFWYHTKDKNSIEYVRTDAFIEKAVEWIKEKWDNNYTMPIIIDSVIEDFKNHIKGE